MSNRCFSSFRKITHCLFDIDGLLLDTESIYEQIVTRILKKFKKTYPLDLRLKILGTTEQKSALTVVKDLKLPITVQEYLKEFKQLENEMLGDCQLKKGAEKLVRNLHANKVPIALATSSSDYAVKLKTQRHRELFALFSHLVCGSSDPDVKEGKPAPDIFLVTAKRFCDQPDPSCCLVFEDAPNGVKAAFSAGMQCVMVPEPHLPKDLRNATLVLCSLEEFKPEPFGLPTFSSIRN